MDMGRLISEKYAAWQTECEQRFNQLKANEEELNRIFIDIYGLQDELTAEVEDRDVDLAVVGEKVLQEIVPDDLAGGRSLVPQGLGDKVQIL